MIKDLQQNIPQMISFMDTEIDLQPWEKIANVKYISATTVEANLMALVRSLLGHASTSAMFGRGLLDKYPELLNDLDIMDGAMNLFLIGLPAWFPWPGVMQAHLARRRVWRALDDQQRALDALAKGGDVDYSWGDLDDVSGMIMERHKVWIGKSWIFHCRLNANRQSNHEQTMTSKSRNEEIFL